MVEPTAPLVDQIAALDAKEVSARELLDTMLHRVETLDGAVNSVVTLEADRAQAEASAIDDARAAGRPVGVFGGVPVTIKDALATEGIRSTGGAVELTDFVPEQDAEVVHQIRDQGAVVFGKTNVPRWSGDYQSYNEMFGTTNNPWDLTRTPGGSSGGPAAAVAMGLTGFEIGTDIGGSVRLPSSFCGVYGHKPSFGIIPTHGYLDSVHYHRNVADVNVFGPIARSIDDLELLMDLLTSPNPDDAAAWTLDLPLPRAIDLRDFRIAAWLDDEFCPLDPTVHAVMVAAVEALEDAGARVDYDRRPDLDALTASVDGSNLIGAAAEISVSDAFEASEADAAIMSHRQWDVRHRQRGQFRQRWAEFFTDVDVLLCPVAPTPAFTHVHAPGSDSNWATQVLSDFGDMPYRHLLRWNTLTGSAYLPATVPPIGRTADGLPVGMQVVAPYLHDRTALEFARRVSEVVGGYEVPPAALA